MKKEKMKTKISDQEVLFGKRQTRSKSAIVQNASLGEETLDLQDLTRCTICLETFQRQSDVPDGFSEIQSQKSGKSGKQTPSKYSTASGARIPRILTCGHTFCQICLTKSKQSRNENVMICPFKCEKSTRSKIESLTINQTVLQVVDHLQAKQKVIYDQSISIKIHRIPKCENCNKRESKYFRLKSGGKAILSCDKCKKGYKTVNISDIIQKSNLGLNKSLNQNKEHLETIQNIKNIQEADHDLINKEYTQNQKYLDQQMKNFKLELETIHRNISQNLKQTQKMYLNHHENIKSDLDTILNYYANENQKLKLKFKNSFLGSQTVQDNIDLLRHFCDDSAEDVLGLEYHRVKFDELRFQLNHQIDECNKIKQKLSDQNEIDFKIRPQEIGEMIIESLEVFTKSTRLEAPSKLDKQLLREISKQQSLNIINEATKYAQIKKREAKSAFKSVEPPLDLLKKKIAATLETPAEKKSETPKGKSKLRVSTKNHASIIIQKPNELNKRSSRSQSRKNSAKKERLYQMSEGGQLMTPTKRQRTDSAEKTKTEQKSLYISLESTGKKETPVQFVSKLQELVKLQEITDEAQTPKPMTPEQTIPDQPSQVTFFAISTNKSFTLNLDDLLSEDSIDSIQNTYERVQMDGVHQNINNSRSIMCNDSASISINSNITLVTGGTNRQSVCLLVKSDPFQVTTLPQFMPSIRSCHCVVKIQNAVYALGGKRVANQALKNMEVLEIPDETDQKQQIFKLHQSQWSVRMPMRSFRQNFGACSLGKHGSEKILAYGYGTGYLMRPLGFAQSMASFQDPRQPKVMSFELYDTQSNTWSELTTSSGMSSSKLTELLRASCSFVTMLNYKQNITEFGCSETMIILQTYNHVSLPTEILLVTYSEKFKRQSPVQYDPFGAQPENEKYVSDGKPILKLQKLGFLSQNRKVTQNNCFITGDNLIVFGGQIQNLAQNRISGNDMKNQIEIFDLTEAIQNIENSSNSFGPGSTSKFGQTKGKIFSRVVQIKNLQNLINLADFPRGRF